MICQNRLEIMMYPHLLTKKMKPTSAHGAPELREDTPLIVDDISNEIAALDLKMTAAKKLQAELTEQIQTQQHRNQFLKDTLTTENGIQSVEAIAHRLAVHPPQITTSTVVATNNEALNQKRAAWQASATHTHQLEQQKKHLLQENNAIESELAKLRLLKSQRIQEINAIPQQLAALHEQFIELKQSIQIKKDNSTKLRHALSEKRGDNKIYTPITESLVAFPSFMHVHNHLSLMHLPFQEVVRILSQNAIPLRQAQHAVEELKRNHLSFENEHRQLQSEWATIQKECVSDWNTILEIKKHINSAKLQYASDLEELIKLHKENVLFKAQINQVNAVEIHSSTELTYPSFPNVTNSPVDASSTWYALKEYVRQNQTEYLNVKDVLQKIKQQKEAECSSKHNLSAELDRIETFKAHQALLDAPLSIENLQPLAALVQPSSFYQTRTIFKGIPLQSKNQCSLPYLALEQDKDDVFLSAILEKNYLLHCPTLGNANPWVRLLQKPNVIDLLNHIRQKITPDMIEFSLQHLLSKDANELTDLVVNVLAWFINHQKMSSTQAQFLSKYIAVHFKHSSNAFAHLVDVFCKSDLCDFQALAPEVRQAFIAHVDKSSAIKAHQLISYYTHGNTLKHELLLQDLKAESHYELWLQLTLEAARANLNITPITREQLEIELTRIDTFKAHQRALNQPDDKTVLSELAKLASICEPAAYFKSRTPFKTVPFKEGSIILPSEALQKQFDALFTCAIHRGYPLFCPEYGDLNPLLLLYKANNASSLLAQVSAYITPEIEQFLVDQLISTPIDQLTQAHVELFKWLLDNQKINTSHAARLLNHIEKNHQNTSPTFFNLVNAFFLHPLGDFASLNAVVRDFFLRKTDINHEEDQFQLAKWYITGMRFCIHALFENQGEDHYVNCIRIAEIASADQDIIFEQPDPTTMNSIMKLHLDGQGIWGTSDSLINLVTNKPAIFKHWFLSNDISLEYQLGLMRLCPDLFSPNPRPLTHAYVSRAAGIYQKLEDNDLLLLKFAKTNFAALTDAKEVLMLAHTLEKHEWQTQHSKNMMLKLAKNRILETIEKHREAPEDILKFLDKRRPQSLLIYFIPEWLRFHTTSRTIYNGFFANPPKAQTQLMAVKTQTDDEVNAFIEPRA